MDDFEKFISSNFGNLIGDIVGSPIAEFIRSFPPKVSLGMILSVCFVLTFLTGGLFLIFIFPMIFIILVLKAMIEGVDHTQIGSDHNIYWLSLKQEIICISSQDYFSVIEKQLREYDPFSKPPKLGLSEYWDWLNKSPNIALKVYAKIISFDFEKIPPKNQKVVEMARTGLRSIDNSFQYIFELVKDPGDEDKRNRYLETLLVLSDLASIISLQEFQEYLFYGHWRRQNSWEYHLYERKTTAFITREKILDIVFDKVILKAQNLSNEETRGFVKLIFSNAPGKKERFYLQRFSYFLGQAYDFSTQQFKGDYKLWLNKIIDDISLYDDIHQFPLNNESAKILALAYKGVGNYQGEKRIQELFLNKNNLIATS